MRTVFLVCGLLAALSIPLRAADEYSLQAAKEYVPADRATSTPQADPRDTLYFEDRKRHDSHTMLELLLLSGVAVATLVGAFIAARSEKTRLSGRDVIRAVVLIFVVYGAIALAIDVKTTETLTGVIGVLSATAGYLF